MFPQVGISDSTHLNEIVRRYFKEIPNNWSKTCKEVMMNDKEKMSMQIESRISGYNKAIAELESHSRERTAKDPEAAQALERLIQKRNDAQRRLDALRQSDESTWQKLKSELDDFMKDIGPDERGSWSHYK
jgi:chromosome segregation ATPase